MNICMRQFIGPLDWGWVQSYVPLLRVQDTCGIMAIDEDKNKTVGAVIVDNILNNSVQATIILDNSMVLRHGFLEECFDWIYEGLGKDYIYCLVAENNTPSNRLCKRLGGLEQMRLKDAFRDGVDFIVYELHKSRCSYYNRKLLEVA